MATRRLSNVLLRNLPRLSALNTGTVRSSGITTVHRNITSSSVVRKEMLEVTFETGDGASYTVKGREGDNLLDVIVNNDVDLDGFGACEGTLSCSTCHLIFKQEDFDQIDDPCTDEELDMLDLAYGLTDTGACVSLSGSGFLGIYELGAVNCLQRYWPRLMDNADVAGASAGALLAACLVCGVPLETVRGMLLSTAEEARKNVIGPFSPNFKIEHHLRMGLEDFLPLDAHVRANGRLYVSLTKMEGVPSNILVSNWDSKEDLIACLLCSCFIPLFSGVQLPEFRGEKFMDGGFTNNLPRTSENTVTISPFSGMIDICPSDNIEKPIYVTVANEKLVVSYANVVRFIRALIPPPDLELRNLFYVGYHDAHSFLKWRCSKINNRRKH